jgi:hypothetical protein
MSKKWVLSIVIATSFIVSIEACRAQNAADIESLRGRVDALERELHSLKSGLAVWAPGEPNSLAPIGGGDAQQPTMCPKDEYAVGVRWWGASPGTRYCIGCLSGIQVICRKLNSQTTAGQ